MTGDARQRRILVALIARQARFPRVQLVEPAYSASQ
jgi:hypothetical protein